MDEKCLPVVRDGIVIPGSAQTTDSRLEEDIAGSRFEARAGLDLHCHQSLVAAHIEELLAVAAPRRLCAPVDRDLPPGSGSRQRLDADLARAPFIGSA